MILFSISVIAIWSQKDTSQHRFAQTYFGASSHFMLGGNTEYLDSLGILHKTDLPTTFQPKLVIGGLHFWKRVDFYVAFPLPNVKWGVTTDNKYSYSAGIETGARYYPFKIQHGTISPYIGFNWTNFNYSQKIPGQYQGTYINRNALNLETGASFRYKGFILEFNFSYMATNSFRYAMSRTSYGTLNFSPISVGISMKYAFDFTAGSGSNESKKFNKKLDSLLVKKNWHNTFYIGLGPSGVFGLASNSYNSKFRSFIDDPLPGTVCPDFSIGYFFYKPQLNINISFRPMFFIQSGYNFIQKLDRISVALEAYHYLFNYKGFVPYAGMFVSYEYLHLIEKDEQTVVTKITTHLPGWGFMVGWDIKPNKSDWWVLRTNIRFMPYVNMKVNNENYIISQWEFNFIQFVIYPQRLAAIKQLKKENK